MHIDFDEFEHQEMDISKSEVFSCEDVGQLVAWHRAFYDIFDSVQSKIEAGKFSGVASEDWLKRATGMMALSKMVIRWTERRLAELHQDLPPTRGGQDKETIRRLRRELELVRQDASHGPITHARPA